MIQRSRSGPREVWVQWDFLLRERDPEGLVKDLLWVGLKTSKRQRDPVAFIRCTPPSGPTELRLPSDPRFRGRSVPVSGASIQDRGGTTPSPRLTDDEGWSPVVTGQSKNGDPLEHVRTLKDRPLLTPRGPVPASPLQR